MDADFYLNEHAKNSAPPLRPKSSPSPEAEDGIASVAKELFELAEQIIQQSQNISTALNAETHQEAKSQQGVMPQAPGLRGALRTLRDKLYEIRANSDLSLQVLNS